MVKKVVNDDVVSTGKLIKRKLLSISSSKYSGSQARQGRF